MRKINDTDKQIISNILQQDVLKYAHCYILHKKLL